MADIFEKQVVLLDSPMEEAFDITPSDTTALSQVTRGLSVNGAGNVSVEMGAANTVVTLALTVGVIHRIRVKKVRATGTTATGIVGFY